MVRSYFISLSDEWLLSLSRKGWTTQDEGPLLTGKLSVLFFIWKWHCPESLTVQTIFELLSKNSPKVLRYYTFQKWSLSDSGSFHSKSFRNDFFKQDVLIRFGLELLEK